MKWLILVLVLPLIVTSCEDNVTNVTVDSVPACQDTVVVIERVPCIWRDGGWVCLDAPLPDGPDHDRGDGS